MSKESFSHWCLQLQKKNQAKRWRSLVVLVGDAAWTTEQLETSLTLFLSAQESNEKRDKQGLVYGELAHASRANQLISVNRKNYAQYLGTEQDVIVFAVESKGVNKVDNDACHIESDFDVDAFAALSGTLVAGGVFLLLLKPSQVEQVNQAQSQDYFLQRFMQQLAAEHGYFIKQDKTEFPALLSLNKTAQDNLVDDGQLSTAQQVKNLPYGCFTQEQVLAVEAMLKVLSGHRDRPLVLTADRGRGKSSALALAACQMLANAKQPLKIIITAASKPALNIFFQQVETHLPDAKVGINSVEHANGSIVFYAIDVLLKEQPEASIVMVDEAAALPVYLLQQLLSHYHRLIFATTIHGYEGAGRGFSLKFALVLQRLMPNWRKMHINEAIRWASDDPLERFVFASCLLNAKLPNYPNTFLAMNNAIPEIKRESKREIKSEAKVGAESLANNVQAQSDLLSQYKLVTELVTPAQLLQNETLLQQIFAVLVTAHYQTSPSDLRLLLNNSAISLFVLKRENDILGVVMLMREGHADEKLVELIRENQRRLRDQFLPQSLLMHCGIKESFNYSYQRVMRIAIHPQFQGQGLGRHFLSAIERHITRQGIDFIGASFAGNATLLKFWQQAGFAVARVGFSKDKASGEHSCLVTKALTPNASHLQQVIVEQFYQQFDYWLTDEFTHMPAKLVWQLLKGNKTLKTSVLARDILQSVNDFTSGQRQFSSCVYALHQWLLRHCTEQFNPEVLPLVARILQKHSIEKVCQQYGFTGKKALNLHLINYIRAHQVLAHKL
ncbi:GNAT family N-acetyltransferase [Colwellia sp. MB3u-4]|uniref:GNAT family N-acetyltransferase n=1 Tax=Colwellia sp. MB3u-4 TaxID=2759822 RepID=UPI0015F6627B|nr:GNAT family N-acetyltransferase [Colwellia sp. MB3u-4]MBA6289737.1 tRNA(Met) cytidine acetyltransferase [Colwellia sp. MB3u-4]